MNNQWIIGIAITILVVPIVNALVRKYVDPKLPEPAKAKKYLWNIFGFIVQYCFPILYVIYLMNSSLPLNKNFVLTICICIASVLLSASRYFMKLHLKNRIGEGDVLDRELKTKVYQFSVSETLQQIDLRLTEISNRQNQVNEIHEQRLIRLENLINLSNKS